MQKFSAQIEQRSSSELLEPAMLAEIKRLELRTRRNVDSGLLGSYRSAFRGAGLVFSDVREYQPGDDVRSIHWKATARSHKVYVKSYEEERLLNVLLAVDVSRSTAFGVGRSRCQRALEFAALLAFLAQQDQDALGLCLFSDTVEFFSPVSRKRTQFREILCQLAAARELRPGTNLKTACSEIMRHQRRPALVFLISDFLAPDFAAELKLLCSRHDVICALSEDLLSENFPSAGLIEVADAESGVRRLIDTSSRKVRRWLIAEQEQRHKKLEELCLLAGADLLRIGDKPLQAFQRLMAARAKRRR